MNEDSGSDGSGWGLPLDASGDVATALLEFLRVGGPVVAILLVASVVALAIVFAKLLQFRVARIGNRRAAYEALALWRAGKLDEALATAQRARNPAAQALARSLRGQQRGLPEAKIREEVLRYGGDVLEGLRAWFRPLEVISSLAPLLGLFGTVLGMIEAFRQMEQAGSQVNPAVLSGGIWEALLTTAVGLAVAIPVVVVLNWLERRVDRLAHEMDSIVTRVFTEDLSPEATPARLPDQAAGDVSDNQDTQHAPARFRAAAAAGD